MLRFYVRMNILTIVPSNDTQASMLAFWLVFE